MLILHTTDCPKCKILKAKLENKEIPFEINDDTDIMLEKGFLEAPVLELEENVYLNFSEAAKWVNNYKG